jgi:hypothetical protein
MGFLNIIWTNHLNKVEHDIISLLHGIAYHISKTSNQLSFNHLNSQLDRFYLMTQYIQLHTCVCDPLDDLGHGGSLLSDDTVHSYIPASVSLLTIWATVDRFCPMAQ